MLEEDPQVNKLERAKRFLKETARPGLRVVSLALLAACAYGDTFNVSGTFDTPGTAFISPSTITIDTVGTNGIMGETLTIDPTAVEFTFNALSASSGFHSVTINSSTYNYYSAIFDDHIGSTLATLTLDIDLGSNSFGGYAGGALCSDAQYCGGAETTLTLQTQQGVQENVMTLSSSALPNPDLSSGSLTPSAPEPSTALLVVAGGALLALRRRKHRD
jgi:hypothetical protein